jgi:hypothetical protein
MVNIQPVSIWINGEVKTAVSLNLISLDNNLYNTCLFQYFLYDADGIQLITANITMIGQDYVEYTISANSNEYAYNWACTTLHLIQLP